MYRYIPIQPYIIPFLSPDCNEKSDIVFLVDSSGSIEPERFGKVRTLIKEFVGNLSVSDGSVSAQP